MLSKLLLDHYPGFLEQNLKWVSIYVNLQDDFFFFFFFFEKSEKKGPPGTAHWPLGGRDVTYDAPGPTSQRRLAEQNRHYQGSISGERAFYASSGLLTYKMITRH